MQNISVLGSTGSIGTQTMDVLKAHPAIFSPGGFSAGNNISLLAKQIQQFHPPIVSVKTELAAKQLKALLGRKSPGIFWGEKGNIAVATFSKADRVVIATPGLPGILPTVEAIKKKKTIALATKEVLVAAGELITNLAKTNNVSILPVDSEHSAVFQCLQGRSIDDVSCIYLTCSGGPFRGMKSVNLRKMSVQQALKHPSWSMGKKITIDSATLMNKGFEVLEAQWLFGVPLDKIKVIVHPQSVIHSAVEFKDGTIIAQIGPADMRLPIQYALFYPQKSITNSFKKFSFGDYPTISFEKPDKKTFRCLSLAYEAGRRGKTYPSVLNAANDIAVEAVLEGKLPFYKIPYILEQTLEAHRPDRKLNLETIFTADEWARKFAANLISKESGFF